MPASPDAKPGNPDGALVPLERTKVPRSLDQLLEQADKVLADVKPEDLQTLVEGGGGLAGHDDDLRALTASGARIGEVLSNRRAELGQLLASSAQVVQALDTNKEALAHSLSSGARLTAVFARHTDDLVKIMESGTKVGVAGSDLLARSRPDWAGTLAGLDASTHNLADRPKRTHEILQLVPPYLQRLARTFDQGLAWSSDGGTLAGPYQPIYALPLDGKGFQIENIFTPSIAGRIRGDFGGGDPGGALLFLTADEFRRASESPLALEQVKAEALARLAEQGKKMRPGLPGNNLDSTR
jgi:ABC-type transporter Mla subunit MlaD